MRFVSFEIDGTPRFGLEVGAHFVDFEVAPRALGVRDVSAGTRSFGRSLAAFLAEGERALQAARHLLESVEALEREGGLDRLLGASGGIHSTAAVRRLAPIPRPGKIVCVGRNYADHCAEQNQPLPERPLFFLKPASAVIADGDAIEISREATDACDYEGELAFVIGRAGRSIREGEAFDHVAGYTIVNDVTARDLQRDEKQWARAKGLDTFCPIGPCLVTPDEIADPHALDLRCSVNGELRQSSNTRHLVFRIPELVSRLSRGMTLEPGDVISTGTPGGVGAYMTPPRFLRGGDVVRIEIEGIGSLTNPAREHP